MAEEQRKRKATELSDFQGLTQIGHGAFGKVFRGIHRQTKKIFALKKISKREVKAQNMITQLNNQIKISKQLDHSNIVKLYDTFDDGQDIYLVLELAPNGQLFSKLCRQGKLDERTAKQIIKQVLQAVFYLHSRTPPIIHRDIKPQNILLDKNNHVKLAGIRIDYIDFGWSNFLNKPRKTYCGTFDYLAPEMIDKSGHDQKLDIWCLGVLAYQLLTGKTPFVVQGCPKNQVKKLIQQNILGVNINFPNDFPILAKAFILGMVKRKPQERLPLKEIMAHQWLVAGQVSQKQFQLIPMPKRNPKEVPLIDAQQSNIILSLNRRIKQLQQQLNRLRINQKALSQPKGALTDNPQYLTLMSQLRKLRGVEQKNLQLRLDNEKQWQQLGRKQKQLIQLRGQIKLLQQSQQSLDKLKNDKKNLLDRIRKLQNDLQNIELKNGELLQQLSGINDNLNNKLIRGQKVRLNQIQTKQFTELIQKELDILNKKFQQSKIVLNKVLSHEKISKEKEEELIRLRVEQKRIQQQIRIQLKQEYQLQKDRIITETRSQLVQQKQKWLKEREELQRMYQDGSGGGNKGSICKDDLELEVKTLRELQGYNQATINQLKIRVRELEEECKRKK